MNFSHEDKLRSGDLSFEYTESLSQVVKEHIRNDADLMKEIEQWVKEDNEGTELTPEQLKSYIELKIDEMADDAVSRIKLYVEFDIEVKL